MTITFTVEESIAGLRGDHVVRARHPDVDREFALKLLKAGRIRINGAVANLKTMTTAGGTVIVDIAEGRLGPALSPRFVVLREDRGLLIVDKADGVAMHEGPGVGDTGDAEEDRDDDDLPLTDALKERFPVEPGFNGPSFLGRLDRPTSGLVVAAMTEAALRDVEPAWRAGLIIKEYVVVVHGRTPSKGVIDFPLAGRRAHQRGTGVIEEAKTGYTTVGRAGGFSVVIAELFTGRTHQIRRHFKAIGHPLVGDTRYGHRDESGAKGLMLHAWRLRKGTSDDASVTWPERLPKQITSPWPDRIRLHLIGCGIDLKEAEAKAKAVGAPKPVEAVVVPSAVVSADEEDDFDDEEDDFDDEDGEDEALEDEDEGEEGDLHVSDEDEDEDEDEDDEDEAPPQPKKKAAPAKAAPAATKKATKKPAVKKPAVKKPLSKNAAKRAKR